MKADTVTKTFISDNHIFADLFNQYLYGGRQVLMPEQLEERDSTELSLPYGDDGAIVPVQKFRDVKKLCAAKTDGKTDYVLFCAEAQLRTHLAMPVRNSLYDALAYAEQVEAAANSHRHKMEEARKKAKAEQALKEPQGTWKTGPAKEASHGKGDGETAEKKKPDPGEFLGGFWKEDRLIPVVTLTVWLGDGEWDGPLSLFEMLDRRDPELLPYMNNYRMNLAAPGMMTDEEILKYQTGLREVMFFIKYSKDRKKLAEIMDSDRERFENLERRAADMIEAVTGTRMHHEEGDETVNVCKAILDIQQEAYDQGKLQGKLEGEQNERTNTLREKERADAAENRADAAENRADTAENRADAEKSRADAAERELLRLKEEIRRLRVQLAGGN